MTNDLPSVGTEDARPKCDAAHEHMALVTLYALALMTEGPTGAVEQFKFIDESVRALVSERDELAIRVSELEGALCQISDMTYDSWTNGAIAKQIADAALNASKEQP